MTFGKLTVVFISASQGREWGEGTLCVWGDVHVRVRRKKRGRVSEKNQVWARKEKGGCHMGESVWEEVTGPRKTRLGVP